MFARIAITAAVIVGAANATAAPLVTNLEMCAFNEPFDSQEMGLRLSETDMFEIEYFCEFSPALDIHWNSERIETRVGYCSEPGMISPQVWSFVFSPYDTGKVTVWGQGDEEPTVFQSCE